MHGGRGGEVIWRPPASQVGLSNISRFVGFVNERYGAAVTSYQELWEWTTRDVGQGWAAMWDFAGLPERPAGPALADDTMPGAQWFPGARVNFAEQVLGRTSAPGEAPAILHRVEGDTRFSVMSWDGLRGQVARVAASLRSAGVGPGDSVVAVLPNVPEAMVACLAAASLGAVWSSCAPDFAAEAVIERFSQIDPKVLFTTSGYRYGGRWFDRTGEVDKVRAGLPTLDLAVYLEGSGSDGSVGWLDLVSGPDVSLEFHPTVFDDPLWVLFTSGTTGRPKGLVHGHGGAVLGAVQGLLLHLDLHRADRVAQHTSTGWVMWNIILSALMFADSIVLYDGSPTFPEHGAMVALAAEAQATMVGVSGAYLTLLARSGVGLAELLGNHRVRGLWFTGSPIGNDDYDWAVGGLPDDAWFTTITGGTDVGSTFFLAGSIDEPVRRGEFECRGLGVPIAAYDEAGRSVIDEPGELVLTAPVPSMPLYLVNDPTLDRYRASYFAEFEDVWRHGDLVVLHARGGGTLLGRSDATLNRNGIRIGTAEVYSAVETLPEVADALVIDLSTPERARLVLFVALNDGVDAARLATLPDDLRSTLRATRSPRHVPDEVHVVPGVPRTLNGKRVEVPVKRILLGADPATVANRASLANPDALDWFVAFRSRTDGSDDSKLVPTTPSRGK